MTKARNNGQRVGYIRVSTVDQSAARQLDGLELHETFTDKTSGKDTNRPALQAALKHLRSGDVLVVHSLDRLARNLRDLLKLVEELNGRGIAVEFVKENLVFGDEIASPMAKLQLQMMGAFAEFERSLIHERQREGIAIAKANGVYAGHGRPRKMNAATVEIIRGRVATGENVSAIAREFGVSRPTLYRALGH
jgi:DNA invertase Pin-like site-specific DNA recombinase